MNRAGDTGDPELKIRWTIGSQAAFVPFGRTPEQLKQHIVASVACHIQPFASISDLMFSDLLHQSSLLCHLGLAVKRRNGSGPRRGNGRGLVAAPRCAQCFQSIVASIGSLLLQPVNPRQLPGVTA
jgi:hypothetical protein